MLLCFRVMNACVLLLFGAMILSPLWFHDFAVERQLARYLPVAGGVAVHQAPAVSDHDAVIARLHDLRIQIRDDLCRRDDANFLRAHLCGPQAGF